MSCTTLSEREDDGLGEAREASALRRSSSRTERGWLELGLDGTT